MTKPIVLTVESYLTVFALILLFATSLAAQSRIEVGPRVTVVTADGEPANDMMAVGAQLRIRLTDGWSFGAAVDRATFDFEQPARILGIEQDASLEPVDAEVESMIYSAFVERELARSDRLVWFASVGGGIASPEVDDAIGPVAGGGSFDIATDAGSEVILSGAAGGRLLLGRLISLEFALRADHHLAEWEVEDHISGATGTTGDYTALGAHLGVNARF